MRIEIIATGSSGNAFLYDEEVLVDAGAPFKLIKSRAHKIKAVLLSHCHGDHFNKSTIRNLHVFNNDVKFCCGEFLVKKLIDMGIPAASIVTIESGMVYKSGNVRFSPVSLYHEVPNFGYRLFKDKFKVFHATDTSHLSGIKAKNYDVAVIETNHDRAAALAIIKKKTVGGEFSHLDRAIKTHLSVGATIDFMNENSIKKLYPVHIGEQTRKEVFKRLEGVDFEVAKYRN